MKFSKLFLPVFTLFALSSSFNTAEAQSITDIESFTWKPKAVALQALDAAQYDVASAEATAKHPAGAAAVKFREIAFNHVREFIENGRDFPTAIFGGYEVAVDRMTRTEPLFDEHNESVRSTIFDEIVRVLKI